MALFWQRHGRRRNNKTSFNCRGVWIQLAAVQLAYNVVFTTLVGAAHFLMQTRFALLLRFVVRRGKN